MDHLFVLPGDGSGEPRNWADTFSKYLLYCDEQEAEAKLTARKNRHDEERIDQSTTPSQLNTPQQAKTKPLSAFEQVSNTSRAPSSRTV